MAEISDSAMIAALRRQMTIAAARQVVSASNLANVETPGYKARELDFAGRLDEAVATTMAVTDARHLQAAPSGGAPATRESSDAGARRDGNTVQIDRELLEMTRAGGDFAKAQTALAAKFRLVRYAISESR